jgi:single stranded DNA-binding protein
MKYGVNRVTLVGNVGEVPRVSEREGKAFVANFPLATNEHYRNKEGEEVSKTEWHRIICMEHKCNPEDCMIRHITHSFTIEIGFSSNFEER